MNVSGLKRPRKVWCPSPLPSVSMSPWYQAIPNGAVGTWITKKSNSWCGGSPDTFTSICSTDPSDTTRTAAVADGRHEAAPADTTMSKSIRGFLGDFAPAAPGPASPASANIPARTPTLFIHFVWCIGSFLLCERLRTGEPEVSVAGLRLTQSAVRETFVRQLRIHVRKEHRIACG